MTIRLDAQINEGSTAGFKLKVYDVNSSIIVPSSVNWSLYDSFGVAVSSGTVTALSSESLIKLGSSLTMTVSGEVRPEVKRVLNTTTTFNDSELGNGAVERQSFEFTLVNNPGV